MALIKIVLRKMYKNKGFVLFLLTGLLISSALMSSIPLYTQGVLQKVLVKDMEDFQNKSEIYPGTFSVKIFANDSASTNELKGVKDKDRFLNDRVKDFYKRLVDNSLSIDNYMKNKFSKEMPLDTQAVCSTFTTEPKTIVHDNFQPGDFDDSTFCRIKTLSDYENHIKLVEGRLPAKEKTDEAYEVLISIGAQEKLQLSLDRVYVMSDTEKKGFEPIKVKPVGVFDQKDDDGIYWSACNIDTYDESVVMNEQQMLNDVLKVCPTQLDTVNWYYSVDYHKLTLDNNGQVDSACRKIINDLKDIRSTTEVKFELSNIVYGYSSKESRLKDTMWSLDVPVMIMLSIYLFMVSNLIVNKERNEIALLISRGASRLQVVFGYFVEGLILGVIAMALGPILGLYLTKILGASSGFLQFVDREAIYTRLSLESFEYSMLAVVIFLITLLVPAYKASNTSIVDHKRKISREKLTAIWQRTYIDVVLLVIAAYGYYSFSQRQQNLKLAASSDGSFQIDPLLFFVPVLFILGMSLLCLRLYPLFLKLVYRIGKKFWPPSMYGTLIQVSRSSVSYHFLMVFIMLTLSIGTYSATAARTLNMNGEERIEFKNGADIALNIMWLEQLDTEDPRNILPPSATKKDVPDPPRYIEPPIEDFEKLPGVEHVARVFRHDGVTVSLKGSSNEDVSIMGIDPYDFGNVVLYRNGLLPYHINEYLNLLSAETSACLISTQMSRDTGLRVGDSFTASWGPNSPVVFNVYGIVDYWPSYLPVIKPDSGGTEPKFMVTNLPYVEDNIWKEPYNIWLKLKPDTDKQEIYNTLAANPPTIINGIADTEEEIIDLRNDSSQLAINGSLTMGFIISGLICFLGFILYWVLSLKERSLQFGIMRAMGLSSTQLKLMMVWEQVLTSGVAMVVGTLVGLLCSRFYVEFFQLSASYAEQTPPFRVISELADRMKVYGFIGVTMILGLGILIYLLSRIKISNVIKLGED
ncbi:MAG: FtsX-like permease family protein [Bacillota bacterium]|nr:FtsX-like permease family protein [Bacillota bacterium]